MKTKLGFKGRIFVQHYSCRSNLILLDLIIPMALKHVLVQGYVVEKCLKSLELKIEFLEVYNPLFGQSLFMGEEFEF